MLKKKEKRKCQEGHGSLLFLSCLPAVLTQEGVGLILLFCFCMSGNNDMGDVERVGQFFFFFSLCYTNTCVCLPNLFSFFLLGWCMRGINQPPRDLVRMQPACAAYLVHRWVICITLYTKLKLHCLENSLDFCVQTVTRSFRNLYIPAYAYFLQHTGVQCEV